MCNVKMEALKVFLDRWSQNNNNFFSQFKKTVQNNKTRLYDLKYLYNYALVAMPFRPDGLSFWDMNPFRYLEPTCVFEAARLLASCKE